MIVLILEKVPGSLRGELTRWLIEPKTGVFIGNVSTLVREKLWQLVNERLHLRSGAILIWKANTEQGFAIEMRGDTSRKIVDLDGLKLILRHHPNQDTAYKKLNASLTHFRASKRHEHLPDVEI